MRWRSARDGRPALFPVLIGSGREEVALADQVVAELAARAYLPALDFPYSIWPDAPGLRDLVAIFAECAVAFGPDSGPMHIAAAAGCPVVSLWGATAPERSAPWGFADLALTARFRAIHATCASARSAANACGGSRRRGCGRLRTRAGGAAHHSHDRGGSRIVRWRRLPKRPAQLDAGPQDQERR